MNRRIILVEVIVWLMLTSVSAYAFWPFTTHSDMVSYWAPCWGQNNKIFFIKEVTHGSAVYRYWFNVPFTLGGDYLVDKTEVYLCSMNYDGTDKKEIVKLGDTDNDTYWLPMYFDYCQANDLLLLSGGMHPARGEGINGLYTIRTNGTDKKKISEVGMHASWAPDGEKIVYQDGNTIWVMNTDGNNKHMISEKVLVGIKSVKDEHGEVITQNGRYKVVEWGERFEDESPIWSPKGDLIAFVCKGWIWVMKPDGSERRRVFDGNYLGDWFPDGKSLLTSGVPPSGCGRVDLNGNIIKSFKKGGYLSPDGSKLVGSRGFITIDVATGDEIDLFADIKHPEHFVYKKPNNIW